MSKVYDDKGNFLMEIDSKQPKKGPTKTEQFIKECRELLRRGANNEQWEFATRLRLACEIIDRKDKIIFAYESVHAPINPLLAINKDLLDACERLLLYSECVPQCDDRKEAQVFARTTIKIAKAKKDG